MPRCWPRRRRSTLTARRPLPRHATWVLMADWHELALPKQIILHCASSEPVVETESEDRLASSALHRPSSARYCSIDTSPVCGGRPASRSGARSLCRAPAASRRRLRASSCREIFLERSRSTASSSAFSFRPPLPSSRHCLPDFFGNKLPFFKVFTWVTGVFNDATPGVLTSFFEFNYSF